MKLECSQELDTLVPHLHDLHRDRHHHRGHHRGHHLHDRHDHDVLLHYEEFQD